MSQFAPLKDRLDRILAILERFERRFPLQPEQAPTIIEAPQATEAPKPELNAAGEAERAEKVPKRRGRPPLIRD